MKKQLAILGLVGSAVAFGALPVRAAFVSRQVSPPITASAATGGTKDANFVLTLHPAASTATTVTQILWTGALPASGWKVADNVMQLNWNVTDPQGGIQIYTDNSNAAAQPRFVDPTPGLNATDPNGHNDDSNPAGLLLVPATGNDSSLKGLPIAWSIKQGTATVSGGGANLLASDPNQGPTTGAGNRYQWLYLLDLKTPTIDRDGDQAINIPPPGTPWAPTNDTAGFPTPTGPYVNVAGLAGIHTGGGDGEFSTDADHHSFLYMEADFTAAGAQSTYKTSRVIVEAYVQ